MIKLLLMLFVSVLLVLSGCSDTDEVSSRPKPKAKSSQKQKAASKPAEKIASDEQPRYVYYSEGKRDPFESPLVKELNGDTPLTPLQQFDISQLMLTGVVLGLDSPRAMVKAPDKKSYILSIGTLVGKNGGKVIQINNDGVSVEEILKDFTGETRINTVLISLPKRKGVN